jgi:hypothetical protein
MSDYEFYGDEEARIGFESLKRENTTKHLGLESYKTEIQNKGMSKGLYDKAMSDYPGIFKDINPKALTINASKTKANVALEAITLEQAKIGAIIAGGALAAGGLGYSIYRFFKWIKSKFTNSDYTSSDKSDSASEKVDKAKVE